MHVIDQLSDVEFVLSQLEDYMFHRRAQSNDNIKHIGACHGVQEQPTTNLLSFFIALKTTYAKRPAYARTTCVCIHDFSNSFCMADIFCRPSEYFTPPSTNCAVSI